MAHYAVFVVPDAHKTALNRLLAMIAGEDVLLSENASRPASADGSEPATHWYGGRFAYECWLDTHQYLAMYLPVPAGGWPLIVGGNVVLTESDAQAAAEAMVLQVTTTAAEPSPQMAQQTLEAVCAALGIVPVNEEA